MSVRGRTYTLGGTKHPQEFIDDLYVEFFDLHPDESTVDIALAVNPTGEPDANGSVRSMDVVDARIMRVTDPAYDDVERPLTAAEHRYLAVPTDSPIDMLREMIRWGKSVAQGIIWIRKTPEGFATPTEQEFAWHTTLEAIDYATGDAKKRHYFMAAVVNRKMSRPLNVNHHKVPDPNTGLADIDLAIITKIVLAPAEKRGWGEDHPYMQAAREHLAAQAIIVGHENEHGEPHHEAAHQAVFQTAGRMGRLVAEAVINDPTESDEAKELAKSMLVAIEVTERMRGMQPSPYGGDPEIGFRPPVAPADIFGLPKFTLPASDNTKQIGFTPPTDKDRLN